MEVNNLNTQYSILGISLIESKFFRTNDMPENVMQLPNSSALSINFGILDNKLTVVEKLTFKIESESRTEVESEITMAAVFQYENNAKIPIKQFANINAAAMIFPYIREHLSSLTLKAGIGHILLSPVNFTQFQQPISPIDNVEPSL